MGRVKYKSTAKNEWDERTSLIKPQKAGLPFFHEVVTQHIGKVKGQTCIELGAIPGNYLVYFARLGYKITGLDFAKNKDKFVETMKINRQRDYNFISSDIGTFQSAEQYDLVTSFGFIEHFEDLEDILGRHYKLAKPGGLILVTVPNFRYIQWLYHRIFDNKNLAIHNIDAMRIRRVDGILKGLGATKIVAGVYGQPDFWYEDPWRDSLLASFRNKATHILKKIFRYNQGGKLTAPYTIYLYRKGKD